MATLFHGHWGWTSLVEKTTYGVTAFGVVLCKQFLEELK